MVKNYNFYVAKVFKLIIFADRGKIFLTILNFLMIRGYTIAHKTKRYRKFFINMNFELRINFEQFFSSIETRWAPANDLLKKMTAKEENLRLSFMDIKFNCDKLNNYPLINYLLYIIDL